MRTYRLYETIRQGFRMERWTGTSAGPFEVDHLPIGHYRERRLGTLLRFQNLIEEDENLGRVVWTKEFMMLRLRCAEVL